MAKCEKIKRRHRHFAVGDMSEQITIQSRSITPPSFGTKKFSETFSTGTLIWAAINSIDGKRYFDGVETETNITHHIYIRYDATVTAETWVLWDLRRLDILKVEDLDDRKEFMKLVCVDRGLVSKAASQA